MISKNKELINQLLTLQLTIAGYEVTFDEITEMYEAKQYLNPDFRWFIDLGFTMTKEQNKQWLEEATKIIRAKKHCTTKEAYQNASCLDFLQGLYIKN